MLVAAPLTARPASRAASLRRPAARCAAGRVVVSAAAAPVESFKLKDGREVAVFATTADATAAVASAFVAAYNEARATANARRRMRRAARAGLRAANERATRRASAAGGAQEGQPDGGDSQRCAGLGSWDGTARSGAIR
jgi:hypothetical protein